MPHILHTVKYSYITYHTTGKLMIMWLLKNWTKKLEIYKREFEKNQWSALFGGPPNITAAARVYNFLKTTFKDIH
jgi:hypothetical protein